MFLKTAEARGIYGLIESEAYQVAEKKLQGQSQNAETHFLSGLVAMKLKQYPKAQKEFSKAIKQSNDTELKLYSFIQLGYVDYELAQKQSAGLGKIASRKAWEHALECLCELVRDRSVRRSPQELRKHCDDTDFVWIDLLRLYNQQGFLREANIKAAQLSEIYKYPSDSAFTLTLQAEIKLAKVLFLWAQFETAEVSLNALHFEAITGFEKVLKTNPEMVAVTTIYDEYRKLLSRSKDLDPVAYREYLNAANHFAKTHNLNMDLQETPSEGFTLDTNSDRPIFPK